MVTYQREFVVFSLFTFGHILEGTTYLDAFCPSEAHFIRQRGRTQFEGISWSIYHVTIISQTPPQLET